MNPTDQANRGDRPPAKSAAVRWFLRVAPELRRQRGRIVVAFFALFLEVGFRLLEPWPLQWVLDRVLIPGLGKEADTAGSLPGGMEPGTLLAVAALGVVALAGLRALAAYWNTVGFAVVGNRVLSDVRSKVFRKLQYLPLSFHQEARAGDLVVRVIGDIGLLQDAAVTALLPLLARMFVLLGMVGTMFWMEWRLGILSLVLLPFFGLRTRRLSSRLKTVARQQRRREGAMAATAAESLVAAKAVQSLSLESTFADAFGAANDRSQKADVRGKRLAASLERSVDVYIGAASALVLWCGARFVQEGDLSPGELLVFLAYLKTAFRPLQDLAKYTARLGKASAAAERVMEILDGTSEVADRPDAVTAPNLAGEIEFDSVDFGYRPEQTQLKNVSFRIGAGRCVAVVGASGSGKTTLLGLILRLFVARSGEVRIDGRNVRDYTSESIRRQMAVILQDTALFAGTIRDNIALGVQGASDESVRAAARFAQIHDFIASLPDGYDTEVGERGARLSQGQRQRIAIARAVLRDARILLLDEPVTSLDGRYGRALAESLRSLSRGRTTLWVTHRLAEAQDADLILHLHEGSLIEAGSHAELMGRGGLYAARFREESRERKEADALCP